MKGARLLPIVIALAVLAGLVAILLYGTRKDQPKALFYSGIVESTEHDLAFEIPGTLIEVVVSEGDSVESGALLARLDNRELEAQLAGARARLGQAEAKLQELKNGTRVEDLEEARGRIAQMQAELRRLRNGPTQAQLDTARHQARSAVEFSTLKERGARPQEIAQAAARLEQSKAQLLNAQKDKERYQALLAEGAAPAAVVDGKVERYRVAQEGVHERTQALEQLKVGFREEERVMAYEESLAAESRYQDLVDGTRPELIEAAEAQLQTSQAQLQRLVNGPRPEQIQAATEAFKAAEAEVSGLKIRIGKAELRSPLAGLITRRAFEPGETVAPGVGVLQLTVPEETWVDIFLPETDMAKLKIGDPCEVFVDAQLEKPLLGRLSFISQTAEFTPRFVQTERERVLLVYRAKVKVVDPERRLKPGLPADVQVTP